SSPLARTPTYPKACTVMIRLPCLTVVATRVSRFAKFAAVGSLSGKLRDQGTLANLSFSCPFCTRSSQPEMRQRNANFGFRAPGRSSSDDRGAGFEGRSHE